MIENHNSTFLKKMEEHALRENVPLYVTFEITLLCNLRCVHCYNFDRSQPLANERKGQELNPTEILGILDQLAEAGTLVVSFSGGEALVHPHLLDFVKHARSRSMAVKIKSNATLLTPERAKSLVAAGASHMDVSMYGAFAGSHDAFTSKPGSFSKTVEGIRIARDHGLRPAINFIIHRGNFRELEQMVRLSEELEVSSGFSTELTARYDGTTGSQDYRLKPEELEEMVSGSMRELFSNAYQPSENIQCACARLVCGITSTGEVYPCIGAPLASGNLREQSFLKIWKSSPTLNWIRGLRLEDFKECKPCEHRHHCQRSSGAVYADTGNYTGSEPWACMQAELLHKHFPAS